MTDRPILFSASMVRAWLGGHKSMTRRLLYSERHAKGGIIPASATFDLRYPQPHLDMSRHPVGTYWTMSGWQKVKVGDHLWVRERVSVQIKPGDATDGVGRAWYFADSQWANDDRIKWSPAIHMPRWASRLTVAVTATKIERVQDISEADAIAEGATSRPNCSGFREHDAGWSMDWSTVGTKGKSTDVLQDRDVSLVSARSAFGNYWCRLHGSESWSANPWVVAIAGTLHRCNIDKMGDV